MNLKVKIKNYYFQNRLILYSLLIISLLTAIYCSISTANVPIMDYWNYINQLVDKTFGGGVTFNDLWVSQGEHRTFLVHILFIINIVMFRYNVQIFVYTGLLMIILNTLVIYKCYNKIFYEKDKKSILIKKLGFIFIILALFNFNQWEILTLEFSLAFYIRIFLFCYIFIKVDSYLRNINTSKIYTLELSFLFVSVICFFSSGYFPAMAGSIALSIILHYILSYSIDKNKYIKLYITLILMLFISGAIYLYNIGSLTDSTLLSSFNELFYNIINGNFFKGFFVIIGSSIFHYEIANRYGDINFYTCMGIILTFVYLFSLTYYFKYKRYKRSYFPILLIGYCFINNILIFFARFDIEQGNIAYLASSRYVCETTLGLAGVVWILIDYIIFKVDSSKYSIKKLIIPLIFLIWIGFGLILSCIFELNVAPYRRLYKDNLINIMQNINNANDEDLKGFQANSSIQVREGVKLMKKYKLGIFKND